jgi:DNA polymerase III epsilon subunit-like protein
LKAIFTALKNDYIAIVDPKRKQDMKKKMSIICNSINSELECALNTMLSYSSKNLKDLVRYLMLAFKVSNDMQAKFDRLLPKTMYIMRCEGQDKFGKVSPEMTTSHHPRILYERTISPFKRRIHMVRYFARYYMEAIKKGKLRLITRQHGHNAKVHRIKQHWNDHLGQSKAVDL